MSVFIARRVFVSADFIFENRPALAVGFSDAGCSGPESGSSSFFLDRQKAIVLLRLVVWCGSLTVDIGVESAKSSSSLEDDFAQMFVQRVVRANIAVRRGDDLTRFRLGS